MTSQGQNLTRTDHSCEIEQKLEQMRELGGREFVVEMIDLFLSQTADQLSEARAYAADRDLHRLRKLAHSLKSSAASFGARALQDIAAALEQAALHGSDDDLVTLVSAMEEQFTHVRA